MQPSPGALGPFTSNLVMEVHHTFIFSFHLVKTKAINRPLWNKICWWCLSSIKRPSETCQWANKHKTRTLEPAYLNGMQPLLVSSVTPVLVMLIPKRLLWKNVYFHPWRVAWTWADAICDSALSQNTLFEACTMPTNSSHSSLSSSVCQ